MDMNDANKLRRLYELYEQPMYRIAFAFLHSREAAEDAVSEAFIRIIGRIDKVGEPDSPAAKRWVVKVIKSTSIDVYRRNKRRSKHEQAIDESVMQLSDQRSSVEEKALAMDMNEMLEGLDETDRRVVLLRCRDELPYKEIAERTSMTEAAARKRFERAKRRIIKLKEENL